MKYFIREICRDDIKYINTWRNNREVVDTLGSSFRYINEEVDVGWFNSYLLNRSSSIRLAICHAESRAIIGAAYLLGIDWVNRSAEFSIWVGEKSYQGKGAGYFAVLASLNHAFYDLNLNRIHLTVLSTNERAINLYKKVGFTEEGLLRSAAFKSGNYIDMLQMSILSNEYKKI